MKSPLILLLILVGCSESPATPAPADEPVRIEFYGEIQARTEDGEYREIGSFYVRSGTIHADGHVLSRLVNDQPVEISLLSAERDSAVIQVAYRNGSQEATIRNASATDVLLDDGAVKLSVSLGATTVAPIHEDDSIFDGPATAYRLDPSVEDLSTASGHRILATKKMTPNQVRRVRPFLTGNGYLALEGADCFDPGMEFQFGQGDDAVHVVVCLECWKLRIANIDSKKLNLFYGLKKSGVEELKALYNEIF
jgi:hypothetical protein